MKTVLRSIDPIVQKAAVTLTAIVSVLGSFQVFTTTQAIAVSALVASVAAWFEPVK